MDDAIDGRQRLEDRLRLLEAAVTNTQDGVLISERVGPGSLDYRIVYANPAIARMTGYSTEELIGCSPRVLRAPATDQSALVKALAILGRGYATSLDVSCIRKDGSAVSFETRFAPVEGDDGAPPLVLSTHQEITGRRAEDARFRAMIRHAADVIGVIDVGGFLRYVSPSVEAILGRAADELVNTPVRSYFHPDDLEDARSLFAKIALEPGTHHQTELRVIHADGTYRTLAATVTNHLEDSFIRGIVINARDVTARRWTDAVLAGQTRILELVAEGAPMSETLELLAATVDRLAGNARAAVLVTADGKQLDWMAAPSLPAAFIDEVGPVPVSPAGGAAGTAAFAVEPAVVTDVHADARFEAMRAAGLRHGIRAAWAAPVTQRSTGRVLGAIALFDTKPGSPAEDHWELFRRFADLAGIAIGRAESSEALTRRALHDSLTELPNRTLFLDRLAQAIARLRREPATLAVLFLDIDRFKVVNDSLGHEAGDQLLQAVADRISGVLRPGDTAARFGGDEFTLLCEGLTGAEDAVAIAGRVADAIREPVLLGDTEVVVTTSVGIAMTTDHAVAGEALLRNADSAMYRAKERGRARFELFDEAMRQQAVARLDMENALRRAVERDQLRIVYQPEIDLRTGHIRGTEALLRWHHPELGVLKPDRFLALAEETGLILPIGAWAVEEACRRAARWWRMAPGSGNPEDEIWTPRLTMRVNLSARQLAHPDLVGLVGRALADSGLPPAALSLEITESALMEDAGAAVTT
ncbi:MAG: hypothetical protein QOG64_2589, partial [Acidimicrobiaceae bacterium]|nr:hypothetical protein [Acidimicrobiaceae bacterium]